MIKSRLNLLWVGMAVVALVLGGNARVWALSTESDGTITATTFIEISKKVLPSVVSIEVQRDLAELHRNLQGPQGPQGPNLPRRPQDLQDLLERYFNGPSPSEEGQENPFAPEIPEGEPFKFKSAGSGFFFSVKESTGYVMTNNHVIEGAKEGEISIILGQSLNDAEIGGDAVTVVERDILGDLAVLKVELGDIQVKPIEWADSDALEIGEWVLALGNPLELRNSVTQGIISAKHREIYKSAIEDLIQTTASINPGNSGGPLVNLDGKVIGINNAIATRTGLWQGVAFAIPSNYAKRISNQILETGRITRGYLGIEMDNLDKGMSEYFNLPLGEGIIVRNVHEKTAAEAAGLKRYDIITTVDGELVRDIRDMLRMIASKPVGAAVDLKVLRESEGGGELQEVAIQALLGERPPEEELASSIGTETPPPTEKGIGENYGLEFDLAAKTGEGLLIKSIATGSLAARAGLRPDDVILQVNRMDISTPDDFKAALAKRPKGKGHLVMYTRSGMNHFTTMASLD